MSRVLIDRRCLVIRLGAHVRQVQNELVTETLLQRQVPALRDAEPVLLAKTAAKKPA